MVTNNVSHFFNVSDAKNYGINAAIILQNIRHWVYENKARGHNFFDGKYWTYNSINAFSEIFNYMTEKQIRGALNSLEEVGAIVSGNYNKHGFDKTKWYTLSENSLANQHYDSFAPEGKPSALQGKASAPEGKPIPYINNNINNNTNKSIVENPTDLSTTNLEDKKESLKLPIKFETELVEIYKYLTEKVGTSFKHTSSHNKFVLARLKEGRTVSEFKKVIDSKCTEWLNDEKMRKFLRPSTLFAPIHFDEYIESSEQAVVSTTSGSYVVSDSARADADAILAEQNYQRDKISNYQIRNNLFQSQKTGMCYETIFCDKSEKVVTLLPIGDDKVIEIDTEQFKILVYKQKIVLRKDLEIETILDEQELTDYQEKYFDYFQKKV